MAQLRTIVALLTLVLAIGDVRVGSCCCALDAVSIGEDGRPVGKQVSGECPMCRANRKVSASHGGVARSLCQCRIQKAPTALVVERRSSSSTQIQVAFMDVGDELRLPSVGSESDSPAKVQPISHGRIHARIGVWRN